MDNVIFDVNGPYASINSKDDLLMNALQLIFNTSGHKKCYGWYFSDKHGLVMDWHAGEGSTRNGCKVSSSSFGLSVKSMYVLALEWLQSEESKAVRLEGWAADVDNDGHNSMGWRVYTEDWGHVDDDHYAICAVTPCYLWHGK